MYTLAKNHFEKYGSLERITSRYKTLNGIDKCENGYNLGNWFDTCLLYTSLKPAVNNITIVMIKYMSTAPVSGSIKVSTCLLYTSKNKP